MGSVQEALLALKANKTPLQALLEGVSGGVANAQDKALENAKMFMAMQEQQKKAAFQESQRKEIQAKTDNQLSAAQKRAGGTPEVFAQQKIKKIRTIDANGDISIREETADDPKEPATLDAIIAGKVQRGEMTLEAAYALKNKGQGDSPTLRYTKEKDAKLRIIPGYTSTGEVQIDDVEARKLREGVSEFETFKEGLTSYKGLIQQYGTSEHSDRNVQGQLNAYAKNLQLKIKNLAQLGVLSSSDVPFIEEQVPGPGIFKTTAGALGALDTAEKLMTTAIEKKLQISGYSKAGGSAPAAGGDFSPDVVSYAQKHSITPAQAMQIKLSRTGGH